MTAVRSIAMSGKNGGASPFDSFAWGSTFYFVIYNHAIE